MASQLARKSPRSLWFGVFICLEVVALLAISFASSVNASTPPLPNHVVVPLVAADGSSSFAASPTTTFPTPNPAYPLLTVALQAVLVSNDDGTQPASVSSTQVQQWVDKANEVFATASVRFLYDPTTDFASLRSTLLNGMTGDTDANWTSEVQAGNQVAASYAGKLVVFFRHGPDQSATGGGFAWVDYNFVAMPGFGTSVCGYQNIGALAHEIGHYLGLSHTFSMIFASKQDAASYFTSHGNDPAGFDGDSLSDTPPDPFINTPEFQCHAVDSVTLAGHTFQLPRKNIMSYYGGTPGVDRTELTAQQGDIVRWILGVRAKNGMETPTNLGVTGAIDFSNLTVTDKAGISPGVQDMSSFGDYSRWPGDRQLFCNAQQNGVIDFSISVGAAGKYALNLYATMAPDFGQVQTLVDGQPLGDPIDLRAPLVLPTGEIFVGTISLSAGGHVLGFRVVGKNAESSGYSFGLSEFTLTPAR